MPLHDANKNQQMMSFIPNILTLSRIALVPVLILLLQNQTYWYALLVFLLAGVTDALDGYIAKRFGFITRLGSILDPLADKLLLISTFVMLTLAGEIPFWLLLTVAFRDLIIVVGVLVLNQFYSNVEIRPILLSKLNTCMQLLLVTIILAEKSGFFQLQLLHQPVIWVVTFTTIVSGLQYVWEWAFHRDIEDKQGLT